MGSVEWHADPRRGTGATQLGPTQLHLADVASCTEQVARRLRRWSRGGMYPHRRSHDRVAAATSGGGHGTASRALDRQSLRGDHHQSEGGPYDGPGLFQASGGNFTGVGSIELDSERSWEVAQNSTHLWSRSFPV